MAVSALVPLLFSFVFAVAEASSYTGWATYFDAVGSTGGCGVTEAGVEATDTPYYVALNVQDSPYDYSSYYSRPITEAGVTLGTWNNGRNCGRYVRLTIGEYCSGVANSGQQYEGFCNKTHWVVDEYVNSTLDLIATDSCYDSNGWCRDDRYHLDIRTMALAHFKFPNGSLTTGLSSKWNNRRISWKWIESPNYSGDIAVGFFGGTKQTYVYLVITHLPNGIHAVERKLSNGTWVSMPNLEDLGQVFVAVNSDWSAMTTLRFRVYDVDDNLIMGGREYEVSIPSTEVSSKYVQTTYTTYGGSDWSSTAHDSVPQDEIITIQSSNAAAVVAESSAGGAAVVQSSSPATVADASSTPAVVVEASSSDKTVVIESQEDLSSAIKQQSVTGIAAVALPVLAECVAILSVIFG